MVIKKPAIMLNSRIWKQNFLLQKWATLKQSTFLKKIITYLLKSPKIWFVFGGFTLGSFWVVCFNLAGFDWF